MDSEREVHEAMSEEPGWRPTEGGRTLGLTGGEGGIIVRDEEHPAGLRLTLEEDASRSFHALTCGVTGWLVHRRYFSSEAEAAAAWEEMRPALVELALRLPASGPKGMDPSTREAGARLGAFVARFP
ncbi:hypothetical protein D187_002590 [Cystobacter fuscus DSM 2262]|uniref:Uncharacterized protein n=1 Tax=Cystobacter fuscus (strain ATCC 25194 / DSM 2262 / NBRC 100088 / M29) TaxID=1242864 RepID=S9P9P0_CYSF2|nr:hypothetical protein [Cystobacter fuscus]EPX59846.1 hypothetical protein D187_002590 [Cystobacter fuscus DSM 2262]